MKEENIKLQNEMDELREIWENEIKSKHKLSEKVSEIK